MLVCCLGGGNYLNKNLISHIPSYFLPLFKVPASIASKLEKLQRNYLWLRTGEGTKDHLF